MSKASAEFKLKSPIPKVPLDGAPIGSRPLVLGSQLGTVIGGGLGIERGLEEGMDDEGNLVNPAKALAKSAIYIPAGATVGTLTGLSGGVLLNRVKGNNNKKALEYTSNLVFNN